MTDPVLPGRPQAFAPGLRRPAVAGLASSVLLAFLTTAGLVYVDILSALVATLQDGLGFSAREAGLVASANIYGAAGGSLAAAVFAPRLPLRRAALGALLPL